MPSKKSKKSKKSAASKVPSFTLHIDNAILKRPDVFELLPSPRVEAVLIASGIITAAQFKAARAFLKAVAR